jgi:DNA-binding NtrC family response regulator
MGANRLLLVDDEETILFAVAQYFRGLSYQVDCAREREEAQALLTCVRYGCLVADVCLSRAHGREGLELASYAHRCFDTRVVLLTGCPTPDTAALATLEGIDAVLTKPVSLDILAGEIRRLVSSC